MLESHQKSAETRRANQTHCKYGHEFTEANTYWYHNKKMGWMIRICRACGRRRNGQPEVTMTDQLAAQGAIVPTGLTIRQIRSRLAAVTTRERYGETKGNRDLTAAHEARRNKTQLWCKRGHSLAAAKIRYRKNGTFFRDCQECKRMRNHHGRPHFVFVEAFDGLKMGTVRISIVAHDRFYVSRYIRLRRLMINKHPDKEHGSEEAFIRARRIWNGFVSSQSRWYNKHHVPLPDMRNNSYVQAVLREIANLRKITVPHRSSDGPSN
jgi:hypothetical protein